LKLKDDKDAHIKLLTKEKNRLHDTLQDMAKRHTQSARALGFVEKADALAAGVQENAENVPPPPPPAAGVDLDEPFEDLDDDDVPEPRHLEHRTERNLFPAAARAGSVGEILESIDKSSSNTRDRMLLNTVKKLTRDLKRKDDERAEKEKEMEKMKMKNEDLVRRIRNGKAGGGGVVVKKVGGAARVAGGGVGGGRRVANATPSPC
jgi:hypothetical protein